MNNYLQNQYIETRSKFEKFSGRLERSQERGEFQRLTPGKQRFLLNRVRRLWEKLRLLEVQLKICSAGVSLALLLMVSNVNAQDQFVQSSGQNPMPPPTIYGWSPVVADLDADGDLDLFITGWFSSDPSVLYFRNEGTEQVPDFTLVPDNENPFRALTDQSDFQSWDVIGTGDVDGDGDVDMLTYDSYSETGFLLTNLGGNDTPLFSEEALDFNTSNMDLGDIDGDGDLDLIQVTYDGTVSVLPNTGDASNFNIDAASPVTEAIGNWNNKIDTTYFTRALDLDGDGDLDLAFGALVNDYDNGIFDWFLLVAENTGNATDPAFSLVDDADNPYMTEGNFSVENLSLGDMDGDGDFDIVLMDYGLGMVYLEMDNGLVENRELVQELYDGILLPYNIFAVPQFADMDGDGDPDLMAFNPSSGDYSYVYFEYQETGLQLKYVKDDQRDIRLLNEPYLVEYPYYVDMDGDGDLDAVSVLYDYDNFLSEFHYFKNTGTAQDPVYQAAANNPFIVRNSYVLPSFADIDDDGDTDLFLSYQIDDDHDQVWMGITSFYENNGGAVPTFTEHVGSENPIDQVREENFPFDYVKVYFGDIDEDGDLDAVFNDYYGLINYFENMGTASQPNFVDKSDTSPFSSLWAGYFGMINLVDMDGDGDLDMMIHYPYSRMLTEYFENTGYKGGTGITPMLSAEGLELFPNPVTSELNIQLQSDFHGTMEYEIMNVLGKQVLTGTIDKPDEFAALSVPAVDLDAGIYMIRIRDGDNRFYLSKFVKQ